MSDSTRRGDPGGGLRVRVDDRLLHAEVIFGELDSHRFGEADPVAVDHLVIASDLDWVDAVEIDQVPPGVRVTVTHPHQLPSAIVGSETTLVVLGTVEDLETALRASLRPSEIALANRARRPHTRRLSATFYVDRREIAILRSLVDQARPVVIQRLLADAPIPLQVSSLDRLDAEPEHSNDTEPST